MLGGRIGGTSQLALVKNKKLHDKRRQGNKEKFPKRSRKEDRGKRRNVLQRREQFYLGELTKFVRTKERKYWERSLQFPYGDSVSKERKSGKLS